MFALFATHCLHLQQHTQFFKGLFAATLLYILFCLSTLLFVIAFQKMPKQAAPGKTKVNALIGEFHNEFISTPSDELFCKLCEKVVKHDKRFHVDQHRNGSVHQAKLTIPTTSRQSFILTPNIPNFNETVVKTFLGANIPLKKLCHPAIRRLSMLQIAIKFNWTYRGYELQHNASVPGSTCTSVSRGSLFNCRIHIESFIWKGFSRHNQLHR